MRKVLVQIIKPMSWLGFLGLLSVNVFAKEHANATLESYLLHVQASSEKLQNDTLNTKQKLKLRQQLINGTQFWQMQKGKPGLAFPYLNFYWRKQPSNWRLTTTSQREGNTVIGVVFTVPEHTHFPWRAEFTLSNMNGEWKITAFTDISKRPVAPNADIATVIDSYLTEVMRVSGQHDNEKPSSEYLLGGGYWVGQTRNLRMPAGKMFTYLVAQKPVSWSVDSHRIAGAFAEAKVNFRHQRAGGTSQQQSFTFELNKVNGEWFLSDFRREQKAEQESHQQAPKAATTGPDDSPNSLVLKQLELLRLSINDRPKQLAEASKSLWLTNRAAKQSMGRLVALQQSWRTAQHTPTFRLSKTTITGTAANISVAIETDSTSPQVFSAIDFQLNQTERGWRLATANLRYSFNR